MSSDAALAAIRPELVRQGFEIEKGKKKAGRIRRPVLFGEVGRPVVAYEVDGFHPQNEIVLEVEAGRGAANNADYRDLIRASLMVDARSRASDDAPLPGWPVRDEELRSGTRSYRRHLRK